MPQLSLSTILTSLFYLLPLYLFVLAPLLRQVFPPDETQRATATAIGAPRFLDDTSEFLSQYAPEDLDYPVLNPEILSVDDGVVPVCEEVGYRVHLLSREPLVIYLEGFLSGEEADQLVELGEAGYTPSIIYDGTTQKIDPSRRLSDRALLPRSNTTVRCLENRARAFQGWRPHLYIERMWAQRYNASGHYRHHYDWAGSAARGGDRLSTFMVYLDDRCEGGGTNFPRLRMPQGVRRDVEMGRARENGWCRFIECEGTASEDVEGITFRPVKGNAIFWENLRVDGSGYPETWHAALPVTSGTKVGLNIWSWYQPPRPKEQ